MTEEFDYAAALAEIESLAAKAEDPSSGIEDIDKCIARAGVLIKACREYLRTAREKLDGMDH